MNVDFLFTILNDYIQYCVVGKSQNEGEDITRKLQSLQEVLDTIIRVVPGSSEAFFYMAKTKFIQGDFAGAELRLNKCLAKNRSNSQVLLTNLKAHMLLAEIHLAGDNYVQALSALEVALSFDFEIRHNISFHSLKAVCQKKQGALAEATSTLETALSISSVREGIVGNLHTCY